MGQESKEKASRIHRKARTPSQFFHFWGSEGKEGSKVLENWLRGLVIFLFSLTDRKETNKSTLKALESDSGKMRCAAESKWSHVSEQAGELDCYEPASA